MYYLVLVINIYFIDNLFSFIQGSTVCLADFCDIFRCDVLDESQRKDYFWEKKLCKEDRLVVRKKRCEVATFLK